MMKKIEPIKFADYSMKKLSSEVINLSKWMESQNMHYQPVRKYQKFDLYIDSCQMSDKRNREPDIFYLQLDLIDSDFRFRLDAFPLKAVTRHPHQGHLEKLLKSNSDEDPLTAVVIGLMFNGLPECIAFMAELQSNLERFIVPGFPV